MGVLRPQPARDAGVSAGGARRRGRGRPRLADKGGKRKGCAEAMRTRGFVGPVRVAALSKLRPGGGYPAAPELSGPGGAVAEEVRVCCWCVCVCACVCVCVCAAAHKLAADVLVGARVAQVCRLIKQEARKRGIFGDQDIVAKPQDCFFLHGPAEAHETEKAHLDCHKTSSHWCVFLVCCLLYVVLMGEN
jgi:hypothetical protein